MSIHYAKVDRVSTTKLWNLTAESFDQFLKQNFAGFKTVTAEQRELEKLIVGWEFLPHHKATMKEYSSGFKAYSRCHDNCVAMHVLILDVDNDPKIDTPKITWEAAVEALQGISCFLYSSFNDRNPEKHGGVDKFRVIVELSKPIPLRDFDPKDGTACVAGALQRLFPWAARESFKPSQPFYMMLQAEERASSYRSLRINGDQLDWTLLERTPVVAGLNKHGAALQFATAPTLKTADASTPIKLTNGTITTVGALYYQLNDGYQFRKPCYSTIRNEQHASSCAFREGRFLIMQDFGAVRRRVKYEIEPAPVKSIEDVVSLLKLKRNQRSN